MAFLYTKSKHLMTLKIKDKNIAQSERQRILFRAKKMPLGLGGLRHVLQEAYFIINKNLTFL